MALTISPFAFLFGLIVGSFLNVVVLRSGTGVGLGGRSKCAHCGRTLSFIDLVPVFSYALLGGRCRTCKARISFLYPSVEFGTGLLFFFIASRFSDVFAGGASAAAASALALSLLFWTLALAIAVYDARHTIIPDAWVFLLMGIGILSALVEDFGDWNAFLLRLAAGAIFGAFFFFLWAFSRGKWMGFGDGKFAFALGIMAGLPALFSAWALSFWIGAIVVLMAAFFRKLSGFADASLKEHRKPLTMKTEIPFGPFLFLGTLLAYLGLVIPFHGI